MSSVLPSVQAREGNRVAWQTVIKLVCVYFAHKPRLCDLVSLSHTPEHTHTTQRCDQCWAPVIKCLIHWKSKVRDYCSFLGNLITVKVLALHTVNNFNSSKINIEFEMLHAAMFLYFQNSMTDGAQQALRRTMEIYSKTTRFALACNASDKIIGEWRGTWNTKCCS